MIVRPVVCRPFIARKEELAFLNERRLLAAQSRGGLVVVAGDAGIGKSRLLAEFSASLAKSRWRIAVGHCLEHARRPYGPLLDLLAALDDNDRPLLPAATKRDQLDALVARFETAASKSALVAIVEDAHWADAATLELLTFLVPKLERMRLLLVVSLRPHDVMADEPAYAGLAKLLRAARSGRIDLAPLDERSLRTFIDAAASDHPLSPDVRWAVGRTCEGNPFFAEELLKNEVERVAAGAGYVRVGGANLPLSLRATLLERWRLLSGDDRDVVAQAAVIGRTFDISLLAQTLGDASGAYLEALRRARDVQLIVEASPSTFRFRHALTRDAIYGEFFGAQLQPLHRNIALALESDDGAPHSLEGLAYHWWAAGDAARSARYNLLAAEAAQRVHAHDDAIEYYERALESSHFDDWERGNVVDKVADLWFTLAMPDRAAATYAVAANHFERAGDVDREAQLRVREALAGYSANRPDVMVPLEAMLDRIDPAAYLARGRLHMMIAWMTASLWRPTEAARHLSSIDPRLYALPEFAMKYHNIAAWVAMTVGDFATFETEFAKWAKSAAANSFTASSSANANGAFCYSTFGEHTRALELVERSFAMAREARNRNAEQSAYAFAAVCALASGDLQRTREALDAVEHSPHNGLTMANACAPGMLAALHLDDREMIATWYDRVGAAQASNPDTSSGAGLAEILARRGKLEEARAVLRRALPACERIRGIVPTLLATAKYGEPVDVVQARGHLAFAAELPNEIVELPALALFDAYVARREGRLTDCAAHARVAAAGFARLRFPLLEAEAWECAGDVQLARTIYQRCGAVGDVRRLMPMRTTSADAPFGRRALAGGEPVVQLSQRESEIAALVALGKSNVEIARSLAISHKTVEKHLGSAFAKLGFTSRTQLAAYVGSGT